jgi:hypothetical protein
MSEQHCALLFLFLGSVTIVHINIQSIFCVLFSLLFHFEYYYRIEGVRDETSYPPPTHTQFCGCYSSPPHLKDFTLKYSRFSKF